jgi:hypothetical protein
MKVYCYGCKTSEETDFLHRCLKCGTMDIGVEEDRGWHSLCRLFAQSKGWQGDRGTISLPLWFQKEPEQLPQWLAFKTKLTDLEVVKLPTDRKLAYWDAYNYWIEHSGIPPLFGGTQADLIITHPIGPLVHKLATTYAEYHKQREEAEQKGREEEEKSKSKGRKNNLIQRVRRRRKSV